MKPSSFWKELVTMIPGVANEDRKFALCARSIEDELMVQKFTAKYNIAIRICYGARTVPIKGDYVSARYLICAESVDNDGTTFHFTREDLSEFDGPVEVPPPSPTFDAHPGTSQSLDPEQQENNWDMSTPDVFEALGIQLSDDNEFEPDQSGSGGAQTRKGKEIREVNPCGIRSKEKSDSPDRKITASSRGHAETNPTHPTQTKQHTNKRKSKDKDSEQNDPGISKKKKSMKDEQAEDEPNVAGTAKKPTKVKHSETAEEEPNESGPAKKSTKGEHSETAEEEPNESGPAKKSTKDHEQGGHSSTKKKKGQSAQKDAHSVKQTRPKVVKKTQVGEKKDKQAKVVNDSPPAGEESRAVSNTSSTVPEEMNSTPPRAPPSTKTTRKSPTGMGCPRLKKIQKDLKNQVEAYLPADMKVEFGKRYKEIALGYNRAEKKLLTKCEQLTKATLEGGENKKLRKSLETAYQTLITGMKVADQLSHAYQEALAESLEEIRRLKRQLENTECSPRCACHCLCLEALEPGTSGRPPNAPSSDSESSSSDDSDDSDDESEAKDQ